MADDLAASEPEAARTGNIKATREDWLEASREILIDQGVEQVKILTVSDRLGVSRSSFYWYFKDRADLLDHLLAAWEEGNTGVIQNHAALPAKTITAAVLNLFRCFIEPNGFNHRLDFAVREWARRSDPVQEAVARSDQTRLAAIAGLFGRYGYDMAEAVSRARILYYMQIGYYALDLSEPVETRLANVPGYLEGFTGKPADRRELAAFTTHIRKVLGETP
ncbi:MAG: TetR/AcrR family transcriptional regulator [Pseudomonadota bacterium]